MRLRRRWLLMPLAAMALLAPIGDAAPATQPAAQASARSTHAECALVASVSTVAAGQPFTVALHFTLDPEWHVYWKDPGDSGMPPSVKWTLPDGFTAGELQFPAPQVVKNAAGTNYVYEDDVALLVQITPPANLPAGATNVPIKADVRWLECNADLCLPGRATLSITADVGDAAVPQMADQFARWQRRADAGKSFDPKTAAADH